MRLIVVSHIGETTLSADSLSIEVARHTLKFTREGGLTFVRALDAHRVKADLNSFSITAITIEGPVSLRFEQEQADQLSRSIRAVYPEEEPKDRSDG